MKKFVFPVFGIILAVSVVQSGAQPPATKPIANKTPATQPAVTDPTATKPESVQVGRGNAELAAIRRSAENFVTDFNKGDASAVAAHWTEDGEYVSETGVVCSGRTAVEDEYKNFFAANPGHRIGIVIDALRLLSDSAAIEDGHLTLDRGHASSPHVNALHGVACESRWEVADVHCPRHTR